MPEGNGPGGRPPGATEGDATAGGESCAAGGRRRLLRTLAAAGAAVAGCAGGGDDGGPTSAGPGGERSGDGPAGGGSTATDAPTTGATTGDPGTTADRTGPGRTTAGGEFPATGDPVPGLAPVEEAVRSFLVDHGVRAAALGVARDGDALLERGYGHRDEDRTDPTPPDARFRIASVGKSFTRAAVDSLVEAGALSLEDSAFRTLGIEPLPGDDPDDRVYDVTVRHLLNHRGGVGPLRSVNPMFDVELTFEMAERMALDGPPTTRQRARFMLGRPLQFDPGSRESYSNFGYAVLGLLVAAASGRSYPAYVRSAVLGGVDEASLYRGRTLPADRRPVEVDYYSGLRGPNVMALDRDDRVPLPDGGFHLEALGGAGGLVATTRTLLAHLADRRLFGIERSGRPRIAGSLPGTFAVGYQHPDGVDVVVLANRRRRTWREDVGELVRAVEEGIAAADPP